MELKLLNKDIGYIEYESHKNIVLGLHSTNIKIDITESILESDETFLSNVNYKDSLIAIIINLEDEFYLHVKNNNVYITKYINDNSKGSLSLQFTFYSERYTLEKKQFNYILVDNIDYSTFTIDSRIFEQGQKIILSNPRRLSKEKFTYLKISYTNFYSFVEYTKSSDSIILKSSNFSSFNNDALKLDFITNNQVKLKTKDCSQTIKLSEVIRNRYIRLDDKFKQSLNFPVFIRVGNRIYAIIQNSVNNNVYIKWDTRVRLLLKYSEYDIKSSLKYFKLNGIIEFKENPKPNQIMTHRGKIIANIEWIDQSKFTAKIPKKILYDLPDIHTSLYFAKNNEIIMPLKRYNNKNIPSKKIVYATTTMKDKALITRLNLANNISISVVPRLPVYEVSGKIKLNAALILSKIFKTVLPKNLNLYFEKEASRVGESGSYIFEEVMKDKSINKHNYYILDKKSPDYAQFKQKWGRNVVERFSLRNYLYIFLAKNFISSELSGHVISGRLFNDKLQDKIKDTPLYFLQHGIMFAKPVDNPMALGFHKENMFFNIKKNVISSDLEAKEFYKMGYDDNDLIKTGLPKLDGAYLNPNANKITFMPTWRYWEESEILNGNLRNSSYFESFMNVIKAFEKANLIHLFQITAHSKFTEYIIENLPQYRNIICDDPTEALKNSRIFITDYSSIIYDSIFRGGYPIFFWKERDYLIENYQAIPPVNDENAPGRIAYSEEQLIQFVQEAIAKNYIIEEKNLIKYRLINEFYDRKNSKRVIEILKNEGIFERS